MTRKTKGDGGVYPKGKKFLAKFPIRRAQNSKSGEYETVYETQIFATKTEANRWLSKKRAAKENGQVAVGGRQTFRSYAEKVLLHGVLQVSPRTADGYYRNLRKHVFPLYGRKYLADIEPAELDMFFLELRKKYSRSTVNAVRTAISAVYQVGVKQRIVTYNPVRHTSKAKKEFMDKSQVKNPWSPEEVRDVLKASIDTPFEAFFHLVIGTGMRRGEILGLQWEHIDYETETVSVEQTIHRESVTHPDGSSSSRLVVAPPKTASSRRVNRLAPPIVQALQRHQMLQEASRALAGDRWQETGFVFTNKDGGPMDERNFYRQYIKFLKQKGIRPIRIHDIRHTFATILINDNGGNLPGVSRALGHSSVKITMDVYASTAQVEDQAFCRMSEIAFPEHGKVLPRKVPAPKKPLTIEPWYSRST
jgi:integrase